MGNYSEEYLQGILDDFGVPPGLVEILNPVTAYKVTYETANAQGTGTTQATGVVVFPEGYFCGLPTNIYHHGSSSNKMNVPSYESAEFNIGLLWASRRYVSVLPDYIGLGDSPGLHPYIHAGTEASASIDLLRASKTLADELGYHLNDDLFLFGYSQGGHATMASYREIQENLSDEFTVTAAIPMSGPYDLDGVQTDFINSGEPYSSPSYLPYIIFGYQEVYGDIYNDVTDVMVSPWSETLPPLFDGTNGLGTINNACDPVPTNMANPVFQADFETNPDNPFRARLRENSFLDFTPMSPTRILYCNQDEQVVYTNALVANAAWNANGAPDTYAQSFGNFDHNGCVQFCLIRAIGVMDSLQTSPIELFTDAVIANSEPGLDNGAIQLLNPNDGMTFDWGNGLEGPVITDLAPGSYTVSVYDDALCEQEYTFEVGTSVSVSNIEEEALSIRPNPASNAITLDVPQGNYTVSIMDLSGRNVLDMEGDLATPINVSSLNNGLYLTKATDLSTGQVYVGKWMKK